MSENTTTPTVDDEFEQRLHRHNAAGDIRTIGCLMDMYPPRHGPGKRPMVVKAAMGEIAMWRQRGHRGEQLEKAAADIAHREHMRAVTIAENHARRRAAAEPCDLCDEDGMVLGRDGKRVLESDGYEIWCRHGKPVDLDDEDD